MNSILGGRDIVFFLGAGFSSDSKYPLMKFFGSSCDDEYRNLKKHAVPGRNFKYSGPMLVESFNVFRSFQKFCKQSIIIKKEELNNMEIVFGIAEVLRESGVTYVQLDRGKYHIQEIISHIQLTLWKIYQRGPLFVKNIKAEMNEIKETIYKPFFEILNKHLPRITFITANYDLIVESMLYELKQLCMYPMRNDGRKKSIFAGQRTIEEKDYRYVKYPLKLIDSAKTTRYFCHDDAILCKLHGSINYFYDSRDGYGDNIFVADDLGNNEKIGMSGVWNNKPSILALDAIWNLHNKYGKSMTPAIIPPTYSKLTGQKWLRDIWNTAIHALARAKKIIFIGYSFPETDGFMRAMIQGAMAMKDTRKLPEIHVIDSSPETMKRYENLFGSRAIIKHEMKLRAALKVIPECLDF